MRRLIRGGLRYSLRHALGQAHDARLRLGYWSYRLRSRLSRPQDTVWDGEAERGDKVCVFSLYQPTGVPESVYYQMQALRDLDFSLFVVSNLPIADADRSRLIAMSWRVSVRPNVGRDFGGYKYGIRQLTERRELENLDRLMLANDSTFGPLHSLRPVYGEMDACECDFWGMNENLEFGNHVASYFLVFKPAAFRSDAFEGFWKRYRELSSRRHSIKKGEIRLSKRLRRSGLRPAVYCSSNRLVRKVREASDLDQVLLWLAGTPFYNGVFDAVGLQPRRFMDSKSRAGSSDAVRHMVARYAVRCYEGSSSSHTFAVFLNKELGMPFLKRDVVKREVQELGYLLDNISITTKFPAASVGAELRVKGTVSDLSFRKRLLHEGGYI